LGGGGVRAFKSAMSDCELAPKCDPYLGCQAAGSVRSTRRRRLRRRRVRARQPDGRSRGTDPPARGRPGPTLRAGNRRSSVAWYPLRMSARGGFPTFAGTRSGDKVAPEAAIRSDVRLSSGLGFGRIGAGRGRWAHARINLARDPVSLHNLRAVVETAGLALHDEKPERIARLFD
jgi:hypothetical protein